MDHDVFPTKYQRLLDTERCAGGAAELGDDLETMAVDNSHAARSLLPYLGVLIALGTVVLYLAYR